MILLVFLLIFVGVFALFLEAALPHGLSFLIGFGLISLAAYLSYQDVGVVMAVLYCFAGIAVSSFLSYKIFRTSLRQFALSPPKKKTGQDSNLSQSQGLDESERTPQIGDAARVVQPLRPTGSVEWEGRRLAARANSPEKEIPAGATVRIRGKDSSFYVVEEPRDETEP